MCLGDEMLARCGLRRLLRLHLLSLPGSACRSSLNVLLSILAYLHFIVGLYHRGIVGASRGILVARR